MTLSNHDKVRLEIGDTDSTDPQLTDDEVNNFLDERTVLDSSGGTVSVNVLGAAADCAGAIAANYARQFDFAEDGQSFSVSQRVQHYLDLERRLRARQGGYSVPVMSAVDAAVVDDVTFGE